MTDLLYFRILFIAFGQTAIKDHSLHISRICFCHFKYSLPSETRMKKHWYHSSGFHS